MKNEELYLNIINNLCDGVYFVDLERRITFWNNAAEAITGYTAEEIIGQKCSSNILNHIDTEGRPLCTLGCPLYASMIDQNVRKDTVFLRHKNGYRIPVLVNIFPIVENGKVMGAIEIFTPNSPKIYEDDLVDQLTSIATKDSLTGLPNRRYLEGFIEYQINEYSRFHKQFAVLFMDIDNFGEFNNNYGHEVGDSVLKNIAQSILEGTRKSDMFGRWGGEEFVGIYQIRKSYEAPIIAENVRILIQNTIVPHTEPLSVTASVGITAVQDGDSAETLIKRADALMYKSKVKGKNCITSD